jgi:hypothetical protein
MLPIQFNEQLLVSDKDIKISCPDELFTWLNNLKLYHKNIGVFKILQSDTI